MEESLGHKLFDRSHRQITLTEAGEYFYREVPQLFAQRDRLITETRQLATGQRATLRFGYSSAAMSNFLPAIIRELRKHLVHCEFEFVEATSDTLMTQVINKQLDAAFILHRAKNPLLTTIPIKADVAGIILPADHPLNKKRSIDLADLKDEPFILFPRHTNPSMYDEILYYCQRAGFSPQKIIETAPRSTAIGLVAAGQGIATISSSLKQSCVSGTIYKPLKQPGPLVRYSCISLKNNRTSWFKIIKDAISSNFAQD